MLSTVFRALLCLFLPKSQQFYISFIYNKNLIYNGKNMPNLVLPTRALKVVNTSIELFHRRGFHIVGVDRLVKESEITKATFYNYFHSKERLIEICLMVQKNDSKKKWLLWSNTTTTQTQSINSRNSMFYIPM